MSNRKKQLSRLDWDFEKVPEDQLVACCYWEYARESAYIRDTLASYRAWWAAGGNFNDPQTGRIETQLLKIQSLGHRANVFLSGCCFKPNVVEQSDDPDKPDYRDPDAPPLTGSFPVPWQSLSKAERGCRARIQTDVEQCRIVPIKLGHWSMAEYITAHGKNRANEQMKAWEAQFLGKNRQKRTTPPRLKETRPGVVIGSTETLLVEIAWGCFTNDEIATYFRRWIKGARPESAEEPDRRGRKRISWRVALEQLGVARLLHSAMFKDIRALYPDAWNTYHTANRRWLRDAEKARARFDLLFPFLEGKHPPLFWPPKDCGAKAG